MLDEVGRISAACAQTCLKHGRIGQRISGAGAVVERLLDNCGARWDRRGNLRGLGHNLTKFEVGVGQIRANFGPQNMLLDSVRQVQIRA